MRNKYYKSTFFLAKKKQEIIKEMIKGMSAVELIKLYINDTSGEIPSNDGNSNNPSGCSPDGDDNDPKETSNNDNSNNSLKQLKSLNGLKIIFGQAEEVNIKIAREAAIKKAKIQRCLNLSKLVESCTKVVLTSKKMELIE